MIRGLRSIEQNRRPFGVGDANDVGHGIDRAEGVGHVRHRDNPGARAHQRFELVEQQLAAIVDRRHAKACTRSLAQHLPGHDVRVMLHGGDEHFIPGANPRGAEHVRHEIDALGRVARVDDFLDAAGVEIRADLLARPFVLIGRQLTEQVDAAVHVGVYARVVPRQRVEHGLRLLRRRRVIEIDERLAVDLTAQNREIGANPLDVEGR